MGQNPPDILDDLVDEIKEELYDPDNYEPDKFYEDVTDSLAVYGYNVEREFIQEINDGEPGYDINSDHLEIISELEDNDDKVYLRFILEDGREDHESPSIDQVDNSKDFKLQPERQNQ